MASKKSARKAGRSAKKAGKKAPSAPASMYLGDKIKVERRYIVEGVLTCVTDRGTYTGVHVVGSQEHLMLENKEGLHMIPLMTISEITIEEQAAAKPAEDVFHDPSII